MGYPLARSGEGWSIHPPPPPVMSGWERGVPHDGGTPWPSQGWGTPSQVRTGGGVPHDGVPPSQGWGTPRQVRTWEGVPHDGVPPSQGWGTPFTPWDRTTDGVLATPLSVCLVRSRRRTFLLLNNFVHTFPIIISRSSVNVKSSSFEYTKMGKT